MKEIVLVSKHRETIKNKAFITDGELDLVKKMADGMSADDIARQLKRSLYTVQTRFYRIRKKTGYRKNTLLVAAFKDQGLI